MDIYYENKIYTQVPEKAFAETGVQILGHLNLTSVPLTGNHQFKDGHDVTGRYAVRKQVKVVGQWMTTSDDQYNLCGDEERRTIAVPLPVPSEAEEPVRNATVTRIEVIDYTRSENCRAFVKHDIKHFEFSYQDNGRTLKIFINS